MLGTYFGERSIVHLNVVDFPVAVERLADRGLKHRPVIVAAPGAARAVVHDMSEEAFQEGIRKGMPLNKARRMCRGAKVVPPCPSRYEQAMGHLAKLGYGFSPLIESGTGDGHLFLDLTGTGRLFGPPQDTAWRLRKEARKRLGLDPTWSVAPNKLVAKAATRLVKPQGEYIVRPGEEAGFLEPLPIGLLPGLEHHETTTLREFNISRIGQAADWSLGHLKVVFGNRGLDLFRAVRGQDDSPVAPLGRERDFVAADHQFNDDTNDSDTIEASLYALVEKAGAELRQRSLAARRVAVTLNYSDGVRIIRQRTEKQGSQLDPQVFKLARSALDLAWVRRIRIRHLRLTCDRLLPCLDQPSLFAGEEQESRKSQEIMKAVDAIRAKFGSGSIRSGRTLAA